MNDACARGYANGFIAVRWHDILLSHAHLSPRRIIINSSHATTPIIISSPITHCMAEFIIFTIIISVEQKRVLIHHNGCAIKMSCLSSIIHYSLSIEWQKEKGGRHSIKLEVIVH
jgi:hypothetical protein